MKSLSLSQPHLIILTGIKGSGKTFFAKKFAETFHAPYVSREWIDSLVSDPAIGSQIITKQFEELLKTKQPIVVDGLSATRTDRVELGHKAREAGYETMLIWVQTDPTTAKNRAIKDSKGQLTSEEYDRIAKRFTPPSAVEKPTVISGKHTYASQAKVVLKKLTGPRTISTHRAATPVRSAESRRSITIR
jgi:predicted kinase